MSTETNTPKPAAPVVNEPEWKTAAREWEASAKGYRAEADAANIKLAELHERERELTTQIAELTANTDRAALLDTVATATGVPSSVLRGDTEAELTAHAQTIKGLMPR